MDKGFLKTKRQPMKYRPVRERVKDYREVCLTPSEGHSKEQASRCMDCGTPFCHWGCPLGNFIPEWNDAAFSGHWHKAFNLLDAANNLPEITGRVCPAHCEYACVLGINDDPVTIRENEFSIIEAAFKKGIIKPRFLKKRTGKKIAVIGSGPAGISCAAQLNMAGHNVVVFEKDAKPGGIMRYGIPDFKLEKWILDRRIKILEKEGIIFETNIDIGGRHVLSLQKEFDAIVLAGGSRVPRDLNIPGRNFKGIYFAMDYLVWSNKRTSGEKIPVDKLIEAKGKNVVIIGGGDTGSDCVGTAHRQGASRVVQIELFPKPGNCRVAHQPWPEYPLLLKTSSSHEEGGERRWSISTKKFIGENDYVKKLLCVKVEKDIQGSEFEIEADLVVLAMGFMHPEKKGLLEGLGVEFDHRGNVKTDENFMTSKKGFFCAGDMRRGQSLIVWAIWEGRRCAYFIDKFLMGSSDHKI